MPRLDRVFANTKNVLIESILIDLKNLNPSIHTVEQLIGYEIHFITTDLLHDKYSIEDIEYEFMMPLLDKIAGRFIPLKDVDTVENGPNIDFGDASMNVLRSKESFIELCGTADKLEYLASCAIQADTRVVYFTRQVQATMKLLQRTSVEFEHLTVEHIEIVQAVLPEEFCRDLQRLTLDDGAKLIVVDDLSMILSPALSKRKRYGDKEYPGIVAGNEWNAGDYYTQTAGIALCKLSNMKNTACVISTLRSPNYEMKNHRLGDFWSNYAHLQIEVDYDDKSEKVLSVLKDCNQHAKMEGSEDTLNIVMKLES